MTCHICEIMPDLGNGTLNEVLFTAYTILIFKREDDETPLKQLCKRIKEFIDHYQICVPIKFTNSTVSKDVYDRIVKKLLNRYTYYRILILIEKVSPLIEKNWDLLENGNLTAQDVKSVKKYVFKMLTLYKTLNSENNDCADLMFKEINDYMSLIIRMSSLHSKQSILTSNNNCSICLESLKNCLGYTTWCNHQFHSSCLNGWLKEGNNICPMCRQNI